MPKSALSSGISFAVGVVFSLLPWGAGLIGVTVSLPLGGLVFAAAFVFITYAFWSWKGIYEWPPAARITTLLLAAVIYFGLVGTQIRKQWILTHTPSVNKSPPVQSPPAANGTGNNGDVTANGDGSVANSGNNNTINSAPPKNKHSIRLGDHK